MEELTLWFTGHDPPELDKLYFSHPILESPRLVVRGKTAGIYRSASSFQWTPAVQALCVLLLKSVAFRENIDQVCPHKGVPHAALSGRAKSPAASLDYAISKQTQWLVDMFGSGANGNPFAARLIHRSNSNGKRPGPILVSLNHNLLSPHCIKVFHNDELLESEEQVATLAQRVERVWFERNTKTLPSQPPIGMKDADPKHTIEEELIERRIREIFGELRPATLSDIEDIFRYEQKQFPGHHATKERLREWRDWDGNNFVCIRYPGRPVMAYSIVFFMKEKALDAFISGSLEEDDVRPDDLVQPSIANYLNQETMHIVVVASKNHTSFLTSELVWHLVGRIVCLAECGRLRRVFAEIATPEGQRMIEKFGFELMNTPVDRKGQPLYCLELTPDKVWEWKTRFQMRSSVWNKKITALIESINGVTKKEDLQSK